MKNNQEGKKVWEKFSSTLDEIKNGIENSSYSAEALDRISGDVDQLEFEGYKTKINFEIGVLKRNNSDLTAMEALVKILSLLPKETSPEMIKRMTDYILGEWGDFQRKVAA